MARHRLGRRAVITAVHALILTVYYWSLSPIALPSHPEWLDLQHTWVTGLPVHFGVIYLGYLAALWLSQRRDRAASRPDTESATPAAHATRALAVGVAIAIVGSFLEALAVGKFPGVTWFVMRILITVPFVPAWWAAAGRDRASAVGGGITLAFILATYCLEGALSKRDRARFGAHLARCPRCTRYLARMQAAITALGRVEPEALAPEAGDELVARYRRWKSA
ncbi:MAG: zf-HC2 domain-containing protein [Actinomycetota bacterium]|nr:zf-HC2 domain-containing protein [Actinomycetota bacterium]